MSVMEPAPARLTNPVVRYVSAARPPFLTASLVPCPIGLAAAFHNGVNLQYGYAALTLIGAVVVHAGINVLNDYYDALIGTDAINQERLYPFTGGSRFIQNRVFTERQTFNYGVILLGIGAVIGAGLAWAAGPGLWFIGFAGVFLGWAYSAPPVSLNSRGLGELSVALGFGVLIPLGADYVQRGAFSLSPVMAGLPYGLLVANLLYINQFPDRRADAATGKRHWVVRLGARRARWGYGLIAALAYGLLAAEVLAGGLPARVLWALLPAAFSIAAAYQLLRYATTPARLAPAIRLTILAALSLGVILAGMLVGL